MTVGRTYLDYNATAPLRPEARAAMLAALDLVGNPSSVHAEGRRARAVIEAARTKVAKLAGAAAADVVFTSGATEANATVLAAKWDTIFLSALEHDSVRDASKRSGARLVEVPLNADGQFSRAKFEALVVRHKVDGIGRALVSLQLANNETGALQPVPEVGVIARLHGVRLHCDAVQAPGRIPVNATALGVDYLTLSAHKIGGPKGVGTLVIVDGAPLPALIAGGGQERGRRSGTENVAGIAGFGAAAEVALEDLLTVGRIETLRNALEQGIREITPHAAVLCQGAPRLPNTSCVALPGMAAETTVIRMDLAGVAVSAGAACSSGKIGHSAALEAMGLTRDLARTAIRFSLGYATTREDIDAFLAAWKMQTAAQSRAA